MSYASQAKVAKNQARDILRTQMADRISTRIKDAESVVKVALSSLVSTVANVARIAGSSAESFAAAEKRNAEFREAIGTTPELTPEDVAALTAIADADDAALAKKKAEAEEKETKRGEKDIADAQKDLKEARENLAHHKDNLAKLEKGEMKVNAEELEELTKRLLEEGAVDAGSASKETEA